MFHTPPHKAVPAHLRCPECAHPYEFERERFRCGNPACVEHRHWITLLPMETVMVEGFHFSLPQEAA